MDGMKSKNGKTSNQAWRRKPRKFAPKSRLGCKTCKIRRVKCDLSRPSCLKCLSTGRTCDGYSEMPLACQTEKTEMESALYHKEIVDRVDSWDNYPSLILQNLGSFMILPVTGSAQAEAMCFFKDISIKHLNEYRPCEPWRNTLIFFSQTVPSVRHAAIALALIHRNYLSTGRVYQPPSLKDRLLDKAPLLHYNRAIQLLLNLESGDSAKITAVTLLVCYLFTCFDHLAGDDVQAVKHLRGGVALSRNIDNAILNNCTYNDAQSSGVHAIICQVTKQIRRLDMQAGMFLVDWTPANIQETFMSHLALFDSAFWSLDQAADHLQILVAQVMRLHNTEQQISPTGTIPPLPSSPKDIVLGQLETWSSLFENLLRQGSLSESDFETGRLVSLLRLQRTITWILLSGYGPGREMDYDNFLPQFQQCVVLAGEVAAAHQRYSGSSRSTFTPEIGLIPVLYIIGAKCRHPTVRREVLSILRRQLIREASWDSISTARVVERVIKIEEGAAGEEQIVQHMEQIPVWRRVEALSYIHIPRGQSAARLDITYTFCGQKGIHVDSLMIEQSDRLIMSNNL
ncbi:hypothetical protein BDV26DRAFT_103252 [Aspergillus bertholletiae]|uniref:Zn(2)-C6 fungal-type domain-containing protein n=1 Tax=Aspergillus bertholletiae TaxID=1226010 RepID=A0A5N7ATW8_9EURO|nr:hypothetical protein BDV26DRAFT_103252 [Aspergillus bertholletiae]